MLLVDYIMDVLFAGGGWIGKIAVKEGPGLNESVPAGPYYIKKQGRSF